MPVDEELGVPELEEVEAVVPEVVGADVMDDVAELLGVPVELEEGVVVCDVLGVPV